MIWLGLGLIGLGVTDLVFSMLRRPRPAELVGAAVAVATGLLCGLDGVQLLGLAVVALVVLAWGESVTYGFGSGRAWIPLAVLAAGVVAGIAASATSPELDGAVGDWLRSTSLGLAQDLTPDRAVLIAGAMLVQLSTGNVIVRLVLAATGTTNPMRTSRGQAPAPALKGGRLLGPLERVFILGLGLAGEVTAASIVIAAKGLLRFPEINSARRSGDAGTSTEPGIHEVTEYFLVGSFVSWLVSLSCLALLAT